MIGSFINMRDSLLSAGFPETDRSVGITSCLWLLGGSSGAYLGTVFGAMAFDMLGFQLGTVVEGAVLGVGLTIIICFGIVRS